MGTSRSRMPVKLQYEPRVDILQQYYDVCAAKYGKLARLVPSETSFFPQNGIGMDQFYMCPPGASHELSIGAAAAGRSVSSGVVGGQVFRFSP